MTLSLADRIGAYHWLVAWVCDHLHEVCGVCASLGNLSSCRLMLERSRTAAVEARAHAQKVVHGLSQTVAARSDDLHKAQTECNHLEENLRFRQMELDGANAQLTVNMPQRQPCFKCSVLETDA